MRTFHITFAFIALTAVLLGSFFMPNTPALWLTNHDAMTQAMRLLLLLILGAQLVTTPPRALALRGLTMASAIISMGFGLYVLGGHSSPVVDTLLFMQAGIALAVTALETKAGTMRTSRAKLIKA